KVNVMTLLETHVSFFPAGLFDRSKLVALDLALHVQRLHTNHFHVKQLFDSFFNFKLGCRGQHLEHNLATHFRADCSLFGNMRTQQNFINTFRVHPSISSIFLSADMVTMTLSKATRLTGSTPCTSRTSTLCKLR